MNQNDRLAAETRQQLAGQLADRAMDMLRDAVAKGYKGPPHVKTDPDLDTLRSREDFQKLLGDLEQSAAR